MKKSFIYLPGIIAATILIVVILQSGPLQGTVKIENYTDVNRPAGIEPDYSGIVIPPNIAPLNFMVREQGEDFLVRIRSAEGESLSVRDPAGSIRIPPGKWKSLLSANRGKELFFEICVKDPQGRWLRYEPIVNTIAVEEIDSYLVYRFMKPVFNFWSDISIHQRNLENYDISPVLHNKWFEDKSCFNCHSCPNNDGKTLTMGVRSATYGSSTLLARGSVVDKIDAKWGYTAWHPSGQVAAYSINKVNQFFHSAGQQIRDVVDLDSAMAYYDVKSKEARNIAAVSARDRLETYPAWTPDGRYLYYCSAPILWQDRNKVPPENFSELKYDLMRVSYDLHSDQWGEAETVLSAEKTGLSILLPRISPDGKFLLFTMCDYGCFPVFRPASDLYLMDLQSGEYHKLSNNSEFSESWHSWSSNSRWIVFSSKRLDGFFTRPFFSYVDEQGNSSKPFVLPQQDPSYYNSLLETLSVPELLNSPVQVNWRTMARALRSSDVIEVDPIVTGASPAIEVSEPWQQRR